MAAGLESQSQDPLARAVMRKAAAENIKLSTVKDVTILDGQGLTGKMAGKVMAGGSAEFIAAQCELTPDLQQAGEQLAADGIAPLYFSLDGHAAGLIGVADAVKPASKAALDALKALGLDVILLTGDSRTNADRVAAQVGWMTPTWYPLGPARAGSRSAAPAGPAPAGPELAKVLDLEQVRPFFASGVWQRIAAARQVLREEPFITALPAGEVVPEAAGQGRAAKAPVLVQGIADVVLVFDDHIELLDYKTDRKKTEQEFLDAYRAQLDLYALAIEKRFAPKARDV